jgi:hypothetical protein
MAYLIHPDNREETVKPKNGKRFSLKEVQALIGGYVQVIDCCDGSLLYVDEEGLPKGLQTNVSASNLLQKKSVRTTLPLVGKVLVCSKGEAL